MSETANLGHVRSFLDERYELRRAHSNSFIPMSTAYVNAISKAHRTWNGVGGFNGPDPVMFSFLTENHLIKDTNTRKYLEILDDLKDANYGYQKDPGQLREAVCRYTAPHRESPIWNPRYRDFIKKWIEENRPNIMLFALEFKSIDDFKERLSNKSASPGIFGAYTGVKKKGDIAEIHWSLLNELEERAIEVGSMHEPTEAAVRLQVSIPLAEDGELAFTLINGERVLPFKYKTRLVNVVSLPRILMEMHYSIPVQMYMGGVDWYAGGKDPKLLLNKINNARMRFGFHDSMDYSSYDQSLPGWFIKDAFNAIKAWFCIKSDRNEKRFDAVVNDFIHKKLVAGDGTLIDIHHGVESGSMFTQIIDTICNKMMLDYYATLSGKKFKRDYWCNICGDDNIVFHDGWFDGKDFARFIDKIFGVHINLTKSSLHNTRRSNPEYLSRTWKFDGIWRDPKELLIKLIYHEYYRVYDDLIRPEVIFKAYIDTYPLGMDEGFDLKRFYSMFPHSTIRGIDREVARSIGGIVAYEMIYGSRKWMTS